MVKPIRTALIFGLGYLMGAGGCSYVAKQFREQPQVVEYKQDLTDKLTNETKEILRDTIDKHLETYKR